MVFCRKPPISLLLSGVSFVTRNDKPSLTHQPIDHLILTIWPEYRLNIKFKHDIDPPAVAVHPDRLGLSYVSLTGIPIP
jgi:hypothetical protein